ncbi:tyrosine-type recombinase/integrase [Dankookia sp. GCM10030260]|uniref:tyrosine-type recombinase/integrase n=1 Tax=Dankookia sp. GCM10030260 TaxID=3273390 RepID=UPI00361BAC35
MNAIPECVANLSNPSASFRVKLTFADLIVVVRGSTTLTETQKRDLISDLEAAAQILGLLTSAVPCDVVWLNQHLFRKSAAACGKSNYRFRNILSSVRKALRLVGLHQPRRCGESELTPEWIELLDAATFQPQRAGLRRLFRYCAVRGLPRSALTNLVFEAFLDEEGATRLSASTTRRGAAVARACNRVIASSPRFSDCQPLQAPRRRQPYTFSLKHFPDLQAEEAVFQEWLSPSQGKSLFKAKGSKRRARPATVKARCFAVRQMAAALVHMGHDPTAITSFAYLVEHASDILDFFDARARAKLPEEERAEAEIVGGQLAVIAETLFIIGAHFLGLTGEPLEQLRAMRKLAQPRRKVGLTGKVRERLLRLIQPYNRSRLLLLPEEVEKAARKADRTDTAMARRFMLAVAILILLVCPLRMKNLAGLRLDQHLQRLGPGGRWITHIVIAGTKMKGHADLEWPVPPAAARLLDTWIRVWRPLMAGETGGSPYLFPAFGKADSKSQAALAEGIKKLIRREIDLEVHPHLMRHFAAWRHLNRHPGQYEIVRRALGHASVETTIATYCGLEAENAARLFHGGLEDDTTEARRLVRAKQRGKAAAQRR